MSWNKRHEVCLIACMLAITSLCPSPQSNLATNLGEASIMLGCDASYEIDKWARIWRSAPRNITVRQHVRVPLPRQSPDLLRTNHWLHEDHIGPLARRSHEMRPIWNYDQEHRNQADNVSRKHGIRGAGHAPRNGGQDRWPQHPTLQHRFLHIPLQVIHHSNLQNSCTNLPILPPLPTRFTATRQHLDLTQLRRQEGNSPK